MRRRGILYAAVLSVLLATGASGQNVTPPQGSIYGRLVLGSPTQNCIAVGPGGTFVGIGPMFTANAQSIVLARESGDLRLVASGFNSIGGCAYDPNSDTLIEQWKVAVWMK